MKRVSILVLFAITTAAGQQLTDLYKQVLRPPVAQAATVENASFAWDALNVSLGRGRLVLSGPVAGHVTAAVFIGQGQLTVAPPSPIERQQLQLFRGRDQLREPFTAAIFRFADEAAFRQALGDGVMFAPIDTTAAAPATELLDQRAKNIEVLGWPLAARLMLAMNAATPDRLLIAELRLTDGTWLEADFDPLQLEPIRIHTRAQNNLAAQPAITDALTDNRFTPPPRVFDDTWTQFSSNGAITPSPWHLDNYDLAVTIPGDLDLAVKGAFDVQSTGAAGAGSGLLLNLVSHLRVTAATTADGSPVGWVQPADPGHFPAIDYEGGWLYLQLPHPLAAGQTVSLKLEYSGKYVVNYVGPGNFFCNERGWYPANPFGPPEQRASFHMHFAVDKKYTAVVSGVRDRQVIEGDRALSDWSTPVPLTAAGFALGDYKETDGPSSSAAGAGPRVLVFSNRQPDDALTAFNDKSQTVTNRRMTASTVINSGTANNQANDVQDTAIGTLDPGQMAPQMASEIANSIRLMTTYFGPLPYSKLAVANIPGDYEQGWPTLLYLSNLSYLDTTQLTALGIHGIAMSQLTYNFRARETSHQWWGQEVGWKTPHDQWLSAGFADGSAVLFEALQPASDQAVSDLKQWRRDLLLKDEFGRVPEQLGAVWLGDRLASSVDPSGYKTVVEEKGGYVFYMLREMMLGTGAPPKEDAAFIAMMRDFTSTYAQRDASTEDFKTIVEKHMTPMMDLDGNHRMDWFFNEYVYGTGVPTVTFTYAVAPTPGGRYKLSMKVENPQNWKGLLPIYIYSDNQHFVRGQLAVNKGELTVDVPVAFQPFKVVANQNMDMLVDVAQSAH